MSSVAILGPDGAGKTTITRMLLESAPDRFRYLYMGVNAGSSNVALLTTRLAAWIKRQRPSRLRVSRRRRAAGCAPERRGPTGSVRAAMRLMNRVCDEWYRQLISWWYQARGYVVLYDRHFLFDFAPEVEGPRHRAFDRRMHRWLLEHLYPRPDLVILLDAPGGVLFARKGEWSPVELERRRRAYLAQAARLSRFVAVDATLPLEEVFALTTRHIAAVCRKSGAETVVEREHGVLE